MKRFRAVVVSLWMVVGLSAPAYALDDLATDESFDVASVDDAALDTMRGGALMINGVPYDFSYFRYVNVLNAEHGIDETTQTMLDSGTFGNLNQEQLSAVLQPLIIQNNLDNSVITAVQQLQVTAPGAMENVIQSNVADQAAFAAIMSMRGL